MGFQVAFYQVVISGLIAGLSELAKRTVTLGEVTSFCLGWVTEGTVMAGSSSGDVARSPADTRKGAGCY